MPHPFVLLLCHADLSPPGMAALEYVGTLVATGADVRVVSLVPVDLGAVDNDWRAHGDLFITPLRAPRVNVVCAPCQGPHQTWASLVTAGVRNILLAGDAPPHETAAAYDVVVVASEAAKAAWATTMDAARLRVIRPGDAEALTALLV